jgi:hypothetical protein
MPLTQDEAKKLIARRSSEWHEHQRTWRWLYDSFEGGQRYRHANYESMPFAEKAQGHWYANTQTGINGRDPLNGEPLNIQYGMVVNRNLVPHLSETATVDGTNLYTLRLHRTPVPTTVARTVNAHLGKIYGREIQRTVPGPVATWHEDTDGKGTGVDQWMKQTIAPLLMSVGQLDLVFDRPEAPKGASVRTRADERSYGLDRVVAGYYLSENVVWWRKDRAGNYLEWLAFERHDEGCRWRHWTETESNAYTTEGQFLPDESHTHNLGFVPIVRCFDKTLPRCGNVGKSRYESIADLQRAIYNSLSELILGDVQAGHSQLMGPEQFLQSDSEIPIGPGNILPIAVDSQGNLIPWSYIEPPKGAQQEVRQHVLDFKDDADRDGALLKPAGMTESNKTTAQSGISKIADSQDGNALLTDVAETLQRCEEACAKMVVRVLSKGKVDPASIKIVYPRQFDLSTADDISMALDNLQRTSSMAGNLPLAEAEFLKRLITTGLPGIDDATIEAMHKEVDAFIAGAGERQAQAAEAEHAASVASNEAMAADPAMTNQPQPA